MIKRLSPNAPRFHTLWEKRENRHIFIFKRKDWDSIENNQVTQFNLNLERNTNLPFSNISKELNFLAAIAKKTDEEVTISIYRVDPKDDPHLINVDKYTVWKSFPQRVLDNRHEMINTADTDADANFLSYQFDHVFIVKEEPDQDHWLEELPSAVIALIEGKNLE